MIPATPLTAAEKAQKINELLEFRHERGQLNGAVLVAENGRVIYKKGFGLANMEWEIRNRPDTKFLIGSVTKQFTAALVMQLAEAGKIKLEGKIIDYLPGYRKDTGACVTVHQLLNHTSGIPSYTELPGFFPHESRNPYGVEEFIEKFASGDFEFEPGSKFSYNNSGYFLLGAIIERVTSESYARVLQKRIFHPSGMKDSGYDAAAKVIKKRASGYKKLRGRYLHAPYLNAKVSYSAGGIFSTVEDLYKWDQALHGNQILSAESKKLMFAPGLCNYGYGFVIENHSLGKPDRETKIIGHTGGIGGFNSSLTRLVDDKHLIVILDNAGHELAHVALTEAIIDILYDQPSEPRQGLTGETLYVIADEKGGAAAVAEYRRLKAENPAAVVLSDGELFRLGCRLLDANKNKDAIEIFKLNVEIDSRSDSAHDGLAEA
jgi:CubicO group peptidase (beta-lactamase class C family)